MPGVIVALIILIIVALLIAVSCVKIVPQATACVVERLGGYLATWSVGIHFKAPFIDRVAKRVVLKEQVVDFPPQPVITKDNVTMQIDTVVYFQVTDPKLFTYGVESPLMAIENLTATTLRNLVGELELDGTLTSRDTVNAKMRIILDEATDPWGIKINRVELKNMEKQMRAERERREQILKAEGEKRSSILVAEGEKESTILRAEAKKAAVIAEAEGAAEAIRLINEANPNAAYLTLKGYEALKVLADGKSTKIVVPSEIQNVSGLLASLKAVVEDDKTTQTTATKMTAATKLAENK